MAALDALAISLTALSVALPAQPHPETPQGEEAIRDGFVREAYEQMGRKCEEMCGRNCPEDRSCEETIVSLRQRIADLEASQPPPEALRADKALAEICKWLSSDNENVKRGDLVAAIRDLAQIAISETGNSETLELRLAAQTEALRALSQQWRRYAERSRTLGFHKEALAQDGCADQLDALSASPAPHTERTE